MWNTVKNKLMHLDTSIRCPGCNDNFITVYEDVYFYEDQETLKGVSFTCGVCQCEFEADFELSISVDGSAKNIKIKEVPEQKNPNQLEIFALEEYSELSPSLPCVMENLPCCFTSHRNNCEIVRCREARAKHRPQGAANSPTA